MNEKSQEMLFIKFMKSQIEKINRERENNNRTDDEFVINWISQNSCKFRETWNNSLCSKCQKSDKCGWKSLMNCNDFQKELEMKRLAVFSGGGCKGYMPLFTLIKLENQFGPLYRYYDLMAGSSVGAINAAILSTGKMSVKTLISIYPDLIKQVFKKNGWFNGTIYNRENFIKIWDQLIGKDFKMKDCKCKLQITSVNFLNQENHFFKSWEEKDGNEKLLDVVLRSFAAPLYFGVLIDYVKKMIWFDGGMGNANLPIDRAFTEARDILKWANDIIQVDAFGCGYTNSSLSFEEGIKHKTFRQLLNYFDFNDGGLARAQARSEQVKKMEIIAKNNNNFGFSYYDIEIPKNMDKLDGIKFLEQYKEYGIKMSEKPLIEIRYRK